MAVILESYEIDSPQHGRPFKVHLVEGLDGAHIDFIEQEWEPLLQRQYDLALLNFFSLPEASRTEDKWIEILGNFGVEDSHWRWRAKCDVALATNRRILALVNDGDVEAAVCLFPGHKSRSNGLPLVYIDYIAVAPWNRKKIQVPPRFEKLGTVLLGAAIAMSMSVGFDGRCGLHSLRQAEGFYRRLGMEDFGVDAAYSSLRYFEFSNQGAKNFIERGDL